MFQFFFDRSDFFFDFFEFLFFFLEFIFEFPNLIISFIFLLFELIQGQYVLVYECERDIVRDQLEGFEVMRNVFVLILIEEGLILFDGSLSGSCNQFGLVNDVFETAVDDEFVFNCLEGELLDGLTEVIIEAVNKHLIEKINNQL